MNIKDRITIVSAISNHDESTGGAVDLVSAALIIADKTDVRRDRVRSEKGKAAFDIHDRVNYAVTQHKLKVNVDKKTISLNLQIDDMMETGLLRVFPLAYIRGMSIKNSFIICDEAQNIGRSLIRDIVTRCGQGSKLVVLGDTNQIDVPFLDKTNSGLTYLAHNMKGSTKCAQITFTEKESVRSALATEALSRLD